MCTTPCSPAARVFEFKAVPPEEIAPGGAAGAGDHEDPDAPAPDLGGRRCPELVAQGCGGDVRKAINAVELLCEAAIPKDGTLLLTEEDAKALAQRSAMRYDRGGDAMYDAASALHKSIRGSDPDAALHYLARFLEAGDLHHPLPPAAVRRQ